MVSSHVNQTGQTLNTKEKRTGRKYFRIRCNDCDDLEGLLRHGLPRWLYTKKLVLLAKDDDPRYYFAGFSHGDIICGNCQTIYGQNIVTTEYMNRVWNDFDEVETPVTLGKSLARSLNALDIKAKRIGRVCTELGCNIQQLKNSTILQRKFIKKWLELYNEEITRHNLYAKIAFFNQRS